MAAAVAGSAGIDSPRAGAAAPIAGKLLGIEAVRGIAALMVVLFHAGVLLSGPKDYGRLPFAGAFGFGRAGVDVFFVLSGFIITFIHTADIGRPGRLVSFARKRLLRIYPSYWICTLILLAIMLISPTPDRREHDLGFILSSLLLLPRMAEPLLGPGWSLRHELLFYGLFALSLLDRRLGAAVLAAWFAAIAANIVAITATGSPLAGGLAGGWLLAPFNIEFLAGMGVTALVLRRRVPFPLMLLVTGVGLFLLCAAAESRAGDGLNLWPPLHVGYAVATALVLAGLVAREQASGLRVPAALVALGDASYALYLLHVIVIMLGVFALRHVRTIVTVPLYAAYPALVLAAVIAALLFTRAIERPMLDFLRRAITRPSSQTWRHTPAA